MTYTAITTEKLRLKPGTLTEKLATEFAAVKAEYDTHGTALSAGPKVAKGVVTGALQNVISFAWQNPESSAILVSKFIVRFTAGGGTGGATMDIGVTPSATDTADTLLDGVDITSAGLFDNVTDKGTNGLPQIIVDAKNGTNDYITGKILGASGASLDGKYYVYYTVI